MTSLDAWRLPGDLSALGRFSDAENAGRMKFRPHVQKLPASCRRKLVAKKVLLPNHFYQALNRNGK